MAVLELSLKSRAVKVSQAFVTDAMKPAQSLVLRRSAVHAWTGTENLLVFEPMRPCAGRRRTDSPSRPCLRPWIGEQDSERLRQPVFCAIARAMKRTADMLP